jgi:hypothetical protein
MKVEVVRATDICSYCQGVFQDDIWAAFGDDWRSVCLKNAVLWPAESLPENFFFPTAERRCMRVIWPKKKLKYAKTTNLTAETVRPEMVASACGHLNQDGICCPGSPKTNFFFCPAWSVDATL